MPSKKREYVACSIDQTRDPLTHRCIEIKKKQERVVAEKIQKKKKASSSAIAKKKSVADKSKKSAGKTYRCCAVKSDGKTRCSKRVSKHHGMCKQHARLNKTCSFTREGWKMQASMRVPIGPLPPLNTVPELVPRIAPPPPPPARKPPLYTAPELVPRIAPPPPSPRKPPVDLLML